VCSSWAVLSDSKRRKADLGERRGKGEGERVGRRGWERGGVREKREEGRGW
jgi:hypothetical protein